MAYSEAWVAVDESSCTIVDVPKIEGRYYTVHFLNGWGETIANINERIFPKRPFGEFAMCLRGANVAIPLGATRIDLAVKYSRLLARVELKRYSVGTKNRALQYNPDGSLTIYVQPDTPPTAQRDNWLPAPNGADFTLYVRAYWPKTAVTDGSWTPPAVKKVS